MATRLTTRQHGNHNRITHNAFSFLDIKNVVRFLRAYFEDNAILLPGRIPGYKRDDIQLLPSNTTKPFILNNNKHPRLFGSSIELACTEAAIRAAAYRSLAEADTPDLGDKASTQTPPKKTNLRYFSNHSNYTIHLAFIKVAEREKEHLTLVTKARMSYLKAQVKATKENIKSHYTDKGLPVPFIGACPIFASENITVHFSFGMTQQV